MSKFADGELKYFGEGVLVGAKSDFPDVWAFMAAVVQETGYADAARIKSVHVRGCVCTDGAADLDLDGGQRFHYEIAYAGSRQRGLIPCWQYGDW